jgi:hypothetical protein
LRAQLVVAESFYLRLEPVDGRDGSVERADVAVVGGPEDGFGDGGQLGDFLMLKRDKRPRGAARP